MFFATRDMLSPHTSFVSDSNQDLITTYAAVRADWKGVVSELLRSFSDLSGDFYYETRSRWNGERSEWSAVKAAACFIFLNKVGFNGLYRVNRDGHFNVPMGSTKNPKICDAKVLLCASQALKTANLDCMSFEGVLGYVGAGDFAYLDPPYHPVSESASFEAYSKDGFDPVKQCVLAAECQKLHERGGLFMLSNSDTPFIRELYQGFHIDSVSAPRSINCDATKRGKVGEVIVRNYRNATDP
jgi:DNA adenine methylase